MTRKRSNRTELTNIALANLGRRNQKESIKLDKRRTSSAISILAPSTKFGEYGEVVNYNWSRTNSSKQKTSVETELHVWCTRRFCAGSRYMLTDIGSRNKYLSQRDRIVWQEEQSQIVLGVWIDIDDASNIDD